MSEGTTAALTAAAVPVPAPPDGSHSNQISGRRRFWALFGVMLVQFTSVIGSTIVANSAPTIVDDLHGLDLYAWVFAGYSIAATICVPVVGKLSDLFGRRVFYIAALGVFLVGSAACGAAQTMPELVAARVVAGAGGGSMLALTGATIGDIFAPRDRARWMGLIMTNFGIGSMVGPIIGGFITDRFGWRWVFLVNLPFILVALFLMAAVMPRIRPAGRAVIDWMGIGLLTGGIVGVLMALTLGGVTFPWVSPQVVLPAGAGAVLLAVFVWHEGRAKEALISPLLFKSRLFVNAVGISFLVRIVFYGALTFLPVYLQGVRGLSAQTAGFDLVPLLVTFIIGNVVSGQIISRSGRYKRVGVAGLTLIVAGLAACTTLDYRSTAAATTVAMAILGLGVGSLFPLTSSVVQSAFPYRILGMVNSGRQFFDNLGTVVGIAIMTTITLDTFTHELPGRLPPGAAPAFRALGPGQLQGLLSSEGQRSVARTLSAFPDGLAGRSVLAMHQSLGVGVTRAFLFALAVGIVALILGVLLPEIPLRTTHD
ncbi:MAG: hypothetical protein NVS9B1_01630 [Candidatus Dormibacteraceae bacterium]